jgi:hypothetical protein
MQRKWLSLLVLLSLMIFTFGIAAAQDAATPEATAEGTETDQQTEAQAQETVQPTAISRIRLVHLAPDAPALVTYVNGAPSGIQTISYPTMTGWVEIPTSAFTLSLIPEGAPAAQAAVGPVTITGPNFGYTTIVVVGSFQDGTLNVYAIEGDITRISEDCARVTMFHAIEGGPAVDIVVNGVSVANIGFPGGEAGSGQLINTQIDGQAADTGMAATPEATADDQDADTEGDTEGDTDADEADTTAATGTAAGQQTRDPLNLSACIPQATAAPGTGTDATTDDADVDTDADNDMDADTEDDADATTTDTTAAATTQTQMMRQAFARSLTCRTLPAATGVGTGQQQDAAETPDTTTEGEQEGDTDADNQDTGDDNGDDTTGTDAGTTTTGQVTQTAANCGFTVEIPARVYSLSIIPTGGVADDAILSLQNVEIAPNTYYFLAAIGTADNPQIFTFATSGAALGALTDPQAQTGAPGQDAAGDADQGTDTGDGNDDAGGEEGDGS